jgi:hypothetical protein
MRDSPYRPSGFLHGMRSESEAATGKRHQGSEINLGCPNALLWLEVLSHEEGSVNPCTSHSSADFRPLVWLLSYPELGEYDR